MLVYTQVTMVRWMPNVGLRAAWEVDPLSERPTRDIILTFVNNGKRYI